jgi:hypothetical protein
VRDAVYVPAVEYVYDGFWRELVPPSPNVQLHDVGALVDASVN